VTAHLLDVNVLIALIDPAHVHHDRAHRWFRRTGMKDWRSCPTTQNGAVRIVSHPRYPNSQPPTAVIESVRSLLEVGGHRFIPDKISLLDPQTVDADALLSSTQVTDTYLLALAAESHARLATFDTRIVTAAARSVGPERVEQIP
jgi:Predicted nucleic acid-binding protein, contains PIN domain